MATEATFVEIAKYWPRGDDQLPRSINWVYERLFVTENRLPYQTLKNAFEGKLSKGNFTTLTKLSRACSQWQRQPISVDDLLVERELEEASQPSRSSEKKKAKARAKVEKRKQKNR